MIYITERTLYPPILQQLSQLSFIGAQEVDLGRDYPDIEFWHGSERFILEVKIGTWQKKLASSIIQARRYAEKAKTDNIILVFYPPEIRRPLVPSLLSDLALKTSVDALILTKYWKWNFTRGKRPSLTELLLELKQKIEAKRPIVSLSLVIETLRESIMMLSDHLRILSDIQLEKLVNTVVGRFDLFLALGETVGVKEEDLKMATIDLSSYLLLNQILFYHIYSQLTKNVPSLPEIKDVESLSKYFKKITDVNYKPIYAVKVLPNLPRTPKINEITGNTVEAIKTISPELVEHELLGRLFHELLPPNTRKLLAAFYTRPVAAEILATLSVDSPNEMILDPACGSGTLLVSAYKRKIELLQPKSVLERALAHTKFVEEQITGLDIMPFASHLSAIHLASQNFDVTTNKVQIGIKDSLRCREETAIEPFSKVLQKTLFEHGRPTKLETGGAISPEGRGEAFRLRKVDTVIMNPPFTKEERLPKDYRLALKSFAYDLQQISGKAAGLWGYFLALATKFMNKKLACVIPINILRGKSSLKLREHFLDGKYTWRYIVKSTENYGFTEKAEYRDILWIVEKTQANLEDKMGVVLIRKNLNKISLDEAKTIGLKILKVPIGKNQSEDEFDIFWVNHKWLFEHKRHLMPIIAFSSLGNMLMARDFIEKVEKRGIKKLKKPSENWFVEGFRPVPMGLSEVVFVTRPFHKGRVKKAFITLVKEKGDYIHANSKNLGEAVMIRRRSTLPSLRTLTGIRTFDISNLHDYVIINRYPKVARIIELSKLKEKRVDWGKIRKECKSRSTHLTVAHRINWYSPNVSHLAFYSDIAYSPSNVLEVVKVKNKTDAKILTLSFNSIISLLQLFMHKEESTGRRLNIRIEDLIQTYVLDITKINKKEKIRLLALFDELKTIQFPSYRQQLQKRFHGRVKLDTTILEILGFSSKEIQNILPKIYDMLYDEMMKIRKLTKD